jgi:hypothetical protein
MDRRLKDVAERLDANLIARREFLRKAVRADAKSRPRR